VEAALEMRSGPRYAEDYDIDVKVTENGHSWTESTVTSNVSVNGLCFVTANLSRYQIGQHVELWIGVPDSHGEITGITTEGEISWKSDDDISTCGELIRPHVGVSLLQPLQLPVDD